MIPTGSVTGNRECIRNNRSENRIDARDGSRTHESLRNWILSPAELATFVPSRSIVFRVYNKKNRDRAFKTKKKFTVPYSLKKAYFP